MLEIEIELYEPSATRPFISRKTFVSEFPNVAIIQSLLSAYFSDIVSPAIKVEKILIREATK